MFAALLPTRMEIDIHHQVKPIIIDHQIQVSAADVLLPLAAIACLILVAIFFWKARFGMPEKTDSTLCVLLGLCLACAMGCGGKQELKEIIREAKEEAAPKKFMGCHCCSDCDCDKCACTAGARFYDEKAGHFKKHPGYKCSGKCECTPKESPDCCKPK